MRILSSNCSTVGVSDMNLLFLEASLELRLTPLYVPSAEERDRYMLMLYVEKRSTNSRMKERPYWHSRILRLEEYLI